LHGSSSLVAWDRVRHGKAQGGLGIKDLGLQNSCLLVKLLHTLFAGEDSSWALWARQHVNMVSLEGDLQGHHWEALRELLPLYRAITTISIGNGRNTSFWHDVWLGDESLADRFPLLLSHCKSTTRSVQNMCETGLQQHLVPRLSTAATAELVQVQEIMANTQLSTAPDRRLSPMIALDGKLQTSTLYKLLKSSQGEPDATAKFIWSSSTPPRVQFFGWLLVHDRVQSKTNLHRRKIVDAVVCDLCGDCPETATHLIFECPVASSFWRTVGVQVPAGFCVSSLHQLPKPAHVPSKHFETLILLCCWQIWKRRNGVIFRQEDMSLQQLIASCRSESKVWAARLPHKDVAVGDQWCSFFSLAM